jgi:hypothetical protein
MTEFWVSSGHHFTQRNAHGALAVTDELLSLFLTRPELLPPDDACKNEKSLYAKLLDNPKAAVTKAMIDGIKDEDARENWHYMIAFRDLLVTHKTVEAAYRNAKNLPPLFLNQMVHLIMRNALDDTQDAFVLRAAECLFRTQRASFSDNTLMLADDEIIEEFEADKAASPLTAMLKPELDVVTDENYWSRSDAHSLILPLGSSLRAREALAKALEIWLTHMLGVETVITPQTGLNDPDWQWFVGLDQEATAIGNALWKGEEVDAVTRSRLLAVFKLTFKDETRATTNAPIWLLMAMDENKTLRLKPQNLLRNLPLKELN